MRLKHHNHLPRSPGRQLLSGRGQHRPHLGRVVGVIVVHLHAPIIPAGDGTVEFEPAAHPGKLGNSLGQSGHIPTGQHPGSERRRCVQHHVGARNLHGYLNLAFPHSHVGV